MAFYPKDMTYEEMMKEFARLVVKMIINDEPNESSQIIVAEKKKQVLVAYLSNKLFNERRSHSKKIPPYALFVEEAPSAAAPEAFCTPASNP